MAKTYEELLEQAAIIRDETAAGKNTATRVGGTITDAVDYVKELQDTYKGIHAEAAEAKTTANAAKTTADEAKKNATAAMNTARSASLNATAANGTANAAKATADGIAATAQEAKEAAAAAKTTAEQAKQSATNAFNSARSAVFTASAAKDAADVAQTTANELGADITQRLVPALEQLCKGGEEVIWDSSKNLNSFVESQNYYITGERTNANDGLPILNANPGHTIFAQLSVLDSSLKNGTGAKTDICVTQVLRLSNRTGGDGHIYVRTGQAATKAELTATNSTKWGTWEKLMGIFEKNVVADPSYLDTYTTNGMYSGLFMFSGPYQQHYGLVIPAGSTFLLVTVNGYAVSSAGLTPQLTQMLYLLPAHDVGQPAKMYLRTAYWNAASKAWVWDIWDRLVTESELSALEARVAALEAK